MRIVSSTTLLAVKHNNYLYFGADRRISRSDTWYGTKPQPKVRKRNGILLMGTGTVYLSDEVIDNMPFPTASENEDTAHYVKVTLVDAVVSYLQKRGRIEKGQAKLSGGKDNRALAHVLIGIKGRLFSLGVDSTSIDAIEVGLPYASGCGGDLAMGSFLTTGHLNEDLLKPPMSIVARIKLAIQTASEGSWGCDDDVTIMSDQPNFEGPADYDI